MCHERMHDRLPDCACNSVAMSGISNARDVHQRILRLAHEKGLQDKGVMSDARPDSPRCARENVNGHGVRLHHTPYFREERCQRVDVLEHMRSEDQVDAGVRERNRAPVIFLHRVIAVLMAVSSRDVQGNDVASPPRQYGGLVPRPCTQLEDTLSGVEPRGYRFELGTAQALEVC